MTNNDNELLPVLIMNAAMCNAGHIDRDTFEELSRNIPRPVAPAPVNEMQPVLDMRGARRIVL